MKLLKNEKIIIQIVRFAPAIFIIISSLLITIYISDKYAKNLIKSKTEIKQTFIEQNKNIIKKNVNTSYNYLEQEYKESLEEIKNEIKQKVNYIHNIMTSIYNKHKNSKSKEEISELIKNTLRHTYFNEEEEFFFIFDKDGKIIIDNNFKQLKQQNLWNFKNAKNISFLQDIDKLLISKNEIFYNWQEKESSKKLGFFKKFSDYDWIIAVAEDLDYFEKKIEKSMINHLKNIKFSNGGYISLLSTNGDIILSKDDLINGQNIHKDKNFAKISEKYKRFINSNIDSTFTHYKTYFYKKEIDKISYYKKIKKHNWVIGVGFDVKKVNELIEKKQEILEEEYNKFLEELIFTALLITIILLIISYYFSKYIEKLFIKYKKRVDERNKKLMKAHKISKIGEWELNLDTMKATWSDEMKEIIGIDKNIDAGPKYLKSIMHKDDFCKFEDSLNNCVNSQKEHFCSYRIIRPNDGKMKYIDCRGELTDNNTITGTIQDVSKQKLLQLENEKQESIIYQQNKMATMGEMIGNIAHQWKQPLSLISMANGLIKINQEDNTFSTKEELDAAIKNIDNAVKHLATTIDDFRNFFKPEKNEKKKFNLASTVDKSLSLISSQLQSKGIELVKDIKDIEIFSIENYLIQILINILNNAKDALISKDIKRKLIFINVKKENEKTIINIYDNAGGIAKDIINKIFEPYFTTKEKTGGTGIGLYMSQDIAIKILDGQITASNKVYSYENEKYKGACFTITLS